VTAVDPAKQLVAEALAKTDQPTDVAQSLIDAATNAFLNPRYTTDWQMDVRGITSWSVPPHVQGDEVRVALRTQYPALHDDVIDAAVRTGRLQARQQQSSQLHGLQGNRDSLVQEYTREHLGGMNTHQVIVPHVERRISGQHQATAEANAAATVARLRFNIHSSMAMAKFAGVDSSDPAAIIDLLSLTLEQPRLPTQLNRAALRSATEKSAGLYDQIVMWYFNENLGYDLRMLETLGPRAGRVHAIRMHPNEPDRLYIRVGKMLARELELGADAPLMQPVKLVVYEPYNTFSLADPGAAPITTINASGGVSEEAPDHGTNVASILRSGLPNASIVGIAKPSVREPGQLFDLTNGAHVVNQSFVQQSFDAAQNQAESVIQGYLDDQT
jgi:hypothetical protein